MTYYRKYNRNFTTQRIELTSGTIRDGRINEATRARLLLGSDLCPNESRITVASDKRSLTISCGCQITSQVRLGGILGASDAVCAFRDQHHARPAMNESITQAL